MNSENPSTSQNSNNQPVPPIPPNHNKTLKILIASSILILFLAITFQKLTPFQTLSPKFKIRIPFSRKPSQTKPNLARPPCVLWMAPFMSPGGYSSEAWSYITSLSTLLAPSFPLEIFHHGDLYSPDFWLGLPETSKQLAYKLSQIQCSLNETIVVCHSEPGAWHPPLYQTYPCPPTGYEDPLFVVGRTMFETDRVKPDHVVRINKMDAVWVPSDFQVSSFVRSGVDPLKVSKLVQPVDVHFFDPSKYDKFDLGIGKLVLGSGLSMGQRSSEDPFIFLSVFKWEYRKGWDVLLKAYLQSFSSSVNVALYLLVNAYHTDTDFASKIQNFTSIAGLVRPSDGWGNVYVIDTHIPQYELPRLYKAGHAFVLPTRGEGWGRPVVEAMAMGLPVIATNWSGITEYLNEGNGYPLEVERMVEVGEGPFKGHLWAEPCVECLKGLMRRVVRDREEAEVKGRMARKDMVEKYSMEVVGKILEGEILKIFTKLEPLSGKDT